MKQKLFVLMSMVVLFVANYSALNDLKPFVCCGPEVPEKLLKN